QEGAPACMRQQIGTPLAGGGGERGVDDARARRDRVTEGGGLPEAHVAERLHRQFLLPIADDGGGRCPCARPRDRRQRLRILLTATLRVRLREQRLRLLVERVRSARARAVA